MLQKAPDKLIGFQGNPFAQSACLVVFIREGDFILFIRKQPVVA